MDPRETVSFRPDPVWTECYERWRAEIEAVSEEGLLNVFHVGSTAVASVPGKPELDVLAVYDGHEALTAAADRLESVVGERGESERIADDGAVVLSRWADGEAVFLKSHVAGDGRATNQLLFREYLQDTPAARETYTELKREAAQRHRDEPIAYLEAKAEGVGELLSEARAAGYESRLPKWA